ncbi:sensor histidine kinase [Pedobacter sp. ASV28]|uniref:sensor histidine kinase n=1 Tax=Pedobacter sp. ASV28 TaxID=2795123 RepID=UPI0018EDBA8A|nr:histidine kinase [Pedobacter sp. ASV28]
MGIRKAKISRQHELQLMEQERNQAELENAFLRSQINPHLLFNTLQFIQYQVERGSAKAVQAVQLLGEIMHYSLKATAQNNAVPLQEELFYIEQYVTLIRLRNDNRQFFELTINQDEAAAGLKLPSGILINFIENIFKHGDLSIQEDPATAHIEIHGPKLSMQVRNLKRTEPVYRTTGTGMANVTKRLDLLYPNRYTLRSSVKNNHYHLYFEIELNYEN